MAERQADHQKGPGRRGPSHVQLRWALLSVLITSQICLEMVLKIAILPRETFIMLLSKKKNYDSYKNEWTRAIYFIKGSNMYKLSIKLKSNLTS